MIIKENVKIVYVVIFIDLFAEKMELHILMSVYCDVQGGKWIILGDVSKKKESVNVLIVNKKFVDRI